MSTNAVIIIEDKLGNTQYFYRHSDGYPPFCGESLKTFLRWLIDKRIRDNTSQAAGWLIMLGNSEYEVGPTPVDWKVGAYEPGSRDITGNYYYVIDLAKKEIRCYSNDPKEACEPFWVVTEKNIDERIKE